MKTNFVLTITLLCSIILGQSFPGENIELLLGREVRPSERDEVFQGLDYTNFYLEYDKEKKEIPPNAEKPFYERGESNYSKLRKYTFKVLNIYPTHDDESVLELYNEEIGTVYYDYNPRLKPFYELEVIGGLEMPDNFYCDEIKKKEDKFEGTIRQYSPKVSGITLAKIEKNGETHLYISVEQHASTLNVGKNGLYLLLDNGEKLSWEDADIDTEYKSGLYFYYAFVELSRSQIEKLLNNIITDKRLYIYDGMIPSESAKEIRQYLRCLLSN